MDVPHLRVNMATLAEQIQMLPQIVHDVRITNVSATILLIAQVLTYSFNLVCHLYVELNLVCEVSYVLTGGRPVVAFVILLYDIILTFPR